MAHLWDRGVLNASSWHGLEEVGVFADATSMLVHGHQSGAWPASIEFQQLYTRPADGSAPLLAPSRAVVAAYCAHPDRVVGVVGDRFAVPTIERWRGLVRAACEAGAQPTGAFSLRDGSTIIGTFEVNGRQHGISTQLLLADSFDGSSKFTCGFSSIRVVCANTLAAALRSDGAGMAQIRHTASIGEKVDTLTREIGRAVASGHKVADLFAEASDRVLTRDRAQAAFDALFPAAAPDASPAARTRAENARTEALQAAALPINRVGDGSNVATLWNAATYLVDRRADGTHRAPRSGDSLDSMLFGQRGKRLDEIQTIVEYVMRDGSVRGIPISEAIETDGAKQDFAALMGAPAGVL